MLLCFFLIVLVLVLMFHNRWKNKKYIKLSEQLKSETPCWPLVGHAYKFIGNGMDHMKAFEHFGREAINRGGLTSIWAGNILFVVIADPIDAEFVLKNYLDKGFLVNFIRDIIGNGNIVAPVSIWTLRRKILVQTVCPKALKSYKHVFEKYSNMIAQKLKSRVGTGAFSIGEYIRTYVTDIIWETSFGEDTETAQKNQFVKDMENGFKLTTERIVSPWLYNSTIYKLFPAYYTTEKLKKRYDEYFDKKITEQRRKIQEENKVNGNNTAKDNNPKSFKSIMDILIEATYGDRQYSDKEVQEEVMILLMAGSDTTASALGFISLMLARHPDVQEKVYEELKEVFIDSNKIIKTEDLTDLKFLDAVVKETLRLYSPVPVIARNSDRDLTLPSGVTIASNCVMIIHLWAVHRNPKYWGSDADHFRPERWLEADFNFKHPSQYMPFSSGSRNCPAILFAMSSMKILMATMLRHYRIMPDTGLTTDGVHKPLRQKYSITMTDNENFFVSLEKRC